MSSLGRNCKALSFWEPNRVKHTPGNLLSSWRRRRGGADADGAVRGWGWCWVRGVLEGERSPADLTWLKLAPPMVGTLNILREIERDWGELWLRTFVAPWKDKIEMRHYPGNLSKRRPSKTTLHTPILISTLYKLMGGDGKAESKRLWFKHLWQCSRQMTMTMIMDKVSYPLI